MRHLEIRDCVASCVKVVSIVVLERSICGHEAVLMVSKVVVKVTLLFCRLIFVSSFPFDDPTASILVEYVYLSAQNCSICVIARRYDHE